MTIREYYKKFHISKLDINEEVEIFFEKWNLLKQIQEEVGDSNSSISVKTLIILPWRNFQALMTSLIKPTKYIWKKVYYLFWTCFSDIRTEHLAFVQ